MRFKIAQKNRGKVNYLIETALKNFTVDGMTNSINLDSTGIVVSGKLRNKISALVMNSNYIWAYIDAPRFMDISDSDKVQFEKITKTVFDVIQETSNFETEKPKIISDYLVGTTAFKVKYTQNLFCPAEIEHAPLKNLYLGNDRKGKPGDVFYLNEKITKYNLSDSFGDEILQVDSVKILREDEEVDIWEATVMYNNKIYYAVAKDNGFREIIYFEEMDYNPWVIARCELLPGSPYGCGPCMQATMEIQGLRNKKRRIEQIGERQARPSYIARTTDPSEVMKSRLNTPGTVSIFRQGTVIEPFQRGENIEVEMFNLQEHKDILNDIFFIDFITAIKNVDDLKNITATATQVAVSKFAEQIEPMYSMIQKELLKGIVMKVYECCLRANLISIDGIDYLKNNPRTSLRFYNAITIAQEQDDLERANMYIQDLNAKFGPTVLAVAINAEAHIDAQKKRYRVSELEFKSGKEVAEELTKLQAEMQQQGVMVNDQQ